MSNIVLQPGSLVGSGAGGLGWGGGATLGVKLAQPNSFVCGMYVDPLSVGLTRY